MTAREFSERDIHLALDGELPADERADFQSWLAANPEMEARSRRFAADLHLLQASVAGIAEEPVPARLSGVVARDAWPPRQVERSRLRLAAAAAALLLVGGLGGYLLGSPAWKSGSVMTAEALLAREAIEAHVLYAAEKLHVVEVGADQSEHLVGWLSKRVGLQLVAPDFTAQGLTFLGGRLLPAGAGRAAQFMYQDGAGNRLSLYITADKGAPDTGFRLVSADGASAYYWLDDGYGCAVVGSMPKPQLLDIANSAYKQLLSGALHGA